MIPTDAKIAIAFLITLIIAFIIACMVLVYKATKD